MPMPLARLTDMHVCPMVAPPGIPHVGGPIITPGAPTVLVDGLPAATLGVMSICAVGPDTVIVGSVKVLFAAQPAARLGDSTSHGGKIVAGAPTVLIG